MNYTCNQHFIITAQSSPVKKSEETGAALPVKDLFPGIPKQSYVEISCLVTYQVVGYVKYTLEFCGLNAMQAGNRHKPTALLADFKILLMTSQALNPTEILLVVLVETKTKTLLRHTVKIQIHNSIEFFMLNLLIFYAFSTQNLTPLA